MRTVRHGSAFFAVISLLAAAIYLLDSTGVLTLKIATAHPVLLLPLLVSVAMAAREWVGLVFGAVFGMMLDVTAADSYFFNFAALLVIGCACGLLCSYFVNDNIYSALLLSLVSSVCYFGSKWLLFYSSSEDRLYYLVTYSLPSACYTALFVIPFYFIVRSLSRKTRRII